MTYDLNQYNLSVSVFGIRQAHKLYNHRSIHCGDNCFLVSVENPNESKE